MRRLFHDFYVQPMLSVYIEALAMYAVWTIFMLILKNDKAKRAAGILGAAGAFALIFCFTILNRNSGARAHSLIPFITFINAKTQPEFYRTMFMNVLLFLPLGLSLPFALPDRIKHRAIVTILTGVLISASVEAAQFAFCLGQSETDDVIMNATGCVIGATSFLLCGLINKTKRPRR